MRFEPFGGLRISAEVIIQIKEHGRAFGGSPQQITKSAQDARPDDIVFIRGEQPEIQILIGEDVKVIEPEICQLLLQLAVAINSAQRLGLLELTERLLRQFAWFGTHSLGRMRLRIHLLSIFLNADSQALGGHVRLWICSEQRLRIQVGSRQCRQAGLRSGLVNFFRMKLALDPIFKPQAFDALQISRTRAVAQPIQCVQDGFVFS